LASASASFASITAGFSKHSFCFNYRWLQQARLLLPLPLTSASTDFAFITAGFSKHGFFFHYR